jgi:hypothetical protein
VSANGVYLVEDTHTCYWDEYGGGLRRPGSFMECVKDRLDEINAMHARGAMPVTAFTLATDAICCYDSIVVFDRRRQGQRQAPITQAAAIQPAAGQGGWDDGNGGEQRWPPAAPQHPPPPPPAPAAAASAGCAGAAAEAQLDPHEGAGEMDPGWVRPIPGRGRCPCHLIAQRTNHPTGCGIPG